MGALACPGHPDIARPPYYPIQDFGNTYGPRVTQILFAPMQKCVSTELH